MELLLSIRATVSAKTNVGSLHGADLAEFNMPFPLTHLQLSTSRLL